MPVVVSCDRYHVLDSGNLVVPVRPEDAEKLGTWVDFPWVLVTDDESVLRDARYDREESIEDINRIAGAFVCEENMFLASPFDVHNAMVPSHVCRVVRNSDGVVVMEKTDRVDRAAYVLGPVCSMWSEMVDRVFEFPDRYAFKPYVVEFLRRESCVVDSVSGQGFDGLVDLSKRHDELFVKNALDKDATGVVSSCFLDETIDDWETALFRFVCSNGDLEAWSYRLPKYLLFQETVTLEYETRFFVVEGKIVSASGRVIDFVPDTLSHRDPFAYADRAVRYRSMSHDEQEVVANPYYGELCGLVEQIIRSIEDNENFAPTCAIDVAWCKTKNQAALVEINGISNAGLYGGDAITIYKALYDSGCYKGVTYGDSLGFLGRLLGGEGEFQPLQP